MTQAPRAAPVEVYVAAGSNVEPLAKLRQALTLLRESFAGLRASSAYRNAAVGFPGDPFVNLVVGFSTALPLDQVLARLHAIEAACGRAREAPRFGPRSMDLDVLLYGDWVGRFSGATLPRPDLIRRAYMLGPLANLAPSLRHPTLGRTIAELWAAFDRTAHPLEPLSL